MEIKPLDIVIALCVGSQQLFGKSPVEALVRERPPLKTVRDYAEFANVSVGAVVASKKRLKQFGLISLVPDFREPMPTEVLSLNRLGVAEFLEYGIRYYSLVERKGYGTGMPTSWACPIIKSEMLPPDTPFVWEDPQGEIRGEYITPIHPSIIEISRKDPRLYRIFSIIDVLRLGKPRELKIARNLLRQYLEIKHDQ